jgi:chromosome segregation ATPase
MKSRSNKTLQAMKGISEAMTEMQARMRETSRGFKQADRLRFTSQSQLKGELTDTQRKATALEAEMGQVRQEMEAMVERMMRLEREVGELRRGDGMRPGAAPPHKKVGDAAPESVVVEGAIMSKGTEG